DSQQARRCLAKWIGPTMPGAVLRRAPLTDSSSTKADSFNQHVQQSARFPCDAHLQRKLFSRTNPRARRLLLLIWSGQFQRFPRTVCVAGPHRGFRPWRICSVHAARSLSGFGTPSDLSEVCNFFLTLVFW